LTRARVVAALVAVVAAALATVVLVEGGEDRPRCPAVALSQGTDEADGVFAALAKRGCEEGVVRTCTVGDGHSPIASETVPKGIREDCFAFNQFIGSGLNSIPGYATGECFGWADFRLGARARSRSSRHPCDSRDLSVDPRVRPDRPAGRALIDGHAPDPIGIPPQEGGLGGKPPPAPPWAVLVWRSTAGATCFEPGQVIGPDTRGLPDVITGVRPTSGGRLPARVLGSLRPDAKSGTGIQIYGVGRFTPYDRAQGGTCGELNRPRDVLVSVEQLFGRLDLGRSRVIVAGVAGRDVAAVDVNGPTGVRRVALGRRRAFITLYRGRVAASRLALRVRYRDGTGRRLRLG
jgi:hypothetical protein